MSPCRVPVVLLTALVAILLALATPARAAAGVTDGEPAAALPGDLITTAVARAQMRTVATGTTMIANERLGGLPETWCGTETTTDTTVGSVYATSVPQFKLVYAYPLGAIDRFDQFKDKLQANVSLIDRFMAGQANGLKTLRFDMGTSCGTNNVDIVAVQLPKTRSAYLADPSKYATLRADVAHLLAGQQNLIVYADDLRGGDGIGGQAEVVTDDTAAPTNANNNGGRVGIVYGAATVPSGAYADPTLMVHEMLHTLGAVQPTALHGTAGFHCSDGWDLMCSGDGPAAAPSTPACALRAGQVIDQMLDCGGDDYFFPGVPATGAPLDGHWNVFDAAFLADCSEVETQASGACGVADTTPPVDTSTYAPAPGPAGWWTSASVTVTLQGTDVGDGVASMEYALDAAQSAAVSVAPGTQITVAGDGTHSLWHRAVDRAGNASPYGPLATSIRIDHIEPSNLTPAVSPAWRTSPLTVSPAGSDSTSGLDRMEWRVDGGTIRTTTPATVTGDGVHLLETRAVDVAGNVSPWRGDTVRIDTVAPADVTQSNGNWRNVAAPITIDGSDAQSGVAQVEWMIDGGVPQSSGAPPYALTLGAEGEHTLSTRITDAAGNVSGWKQQVVRNDTTMPVNTTPAANPAWRTSNYGVNLTGSDSGSGVDKVEWRIDAGAPTSAPAGSAVVVAGNGPHTLETRVWDLAGNVSGWRTDDVNIDATKPTDTTVAPPSTAVPNPYSLTISGTDAHSGVARVEWSVDGGTVNSGDTPSSVSVHGQGAHVVRERVVDNAGNASDWQDRTVTIDVALNGDTVAPADTSATTPAAWLTSSPYNFTINGTDAGSGVDRVEWRIDGQPIQSGAPGTVRAITGDGNHTIETRVWDVAENVSAWRPQTVRIDTTVPVDTTTIPTGWQNTRTFALAASDETSGVLHVQYTIDGGAPLTGPANGTATVATDGSFTVRHRAVDNADQVSLWSPPATLRVDTVPPVDTTPTTPIGWQTAAWTATPSGTDDRSGIDRVEWRLDHGDIDTGDITVDTDGTHTVETRAVDAAGNTSGWRVQTVKVDLNAPLDTTPPAATGWLTAPWATIPAADDGQGSGVTSIEWKLGADGTVFTTPDVVISAEGETVLFTRAIDLMSHASAWRQQSVRIDLTDPAVGLECGSVAWSTVPVVCSAAADGGVSGLASLTFVRAGAPDRAVAPGGTVAVDADGTWPVALVAVDGSGRTARVDRTVRVDRTPPTASLECSGARDSLAYVCKARGADAASGLAALRWRVDGGAWKTPAADGSFSLASGRVEVEAIDVAGHKTLTPAAALGVRRPGSPADPNAPRIRTRSVPVARRGARGPAALLGAFELRSQRAGKRGQATADVRPLMLSPGRYRVTVRLSSGGLTAKRARSVRFRRTGHTPRMGVALSRVGSKVSATLVVERRSGRRWKRVAVAAANLKP